MLRKARRIGALLMALTMIFVLSLSAGAAYYKTPTKADVDGTVVGSITDNEITVSVEITPGSAKSINFYLDGDALNNEFWSKSDAYVEVDITMSTDGDQVYACMPGFTTNWGWVNPTDWNGLLAKGQTTTVREPFSTYYSGGFSSKDPMAIRVQLYTNSSETQNVEVTVTGLRFVGVDDAPVTTTAATTTTEEPEDTSAPEETEAPVEDDEPVDETEDASAPVEDDEPEEVTTTAATTAEPEEENSDRPITTTTQPNKTTSAATTAATTAASADSGDPSFAGPIVIIVIVVVVIAAAAVGFIIYRKKKFY